MVLCVWFCLAVVLVLVPSGFGCFLGFGFAECCGWLIVVLILVMWWLVGLVWSCLAFGCLSVCWCFVLLCDQLGLWLVWFGLLLILLVLLLCVVCYKYRFAVVCLVLGCFLGDFVVCLFAFRFWL